MIHIVYLDNRTNALELILTGKKTIIAKGSMSRRIPYNKIEVGDVIYFIKSKRNRELKASATVTDVYYSHRLSEEESYALLDKYKTKLRLNISQYKKYAGKRYITLVTIADVVKVADTTLNETTNQEKDEWLLVESLEGLLE